MKILWLNHFIILLILIIPNSLANDDVKTTISAVIHQESIPISESFYQKLELNKTYNITKEYAINLAGEALIEDEDLANSRRIDILDIGMFRSSYSDKSWWMIKLSSNKTSRLYAVASDDGIVSSGWDAIEDYEQRQKIHLGKISPLLNRTIAESKAETINVIIVLKDQPDLRRMVYSAETNQDQELAEALKATDNNAAEQVKIKIRKDVAALASQFNVQHGQDSVASRVEGLRGRVLNRGTIRNNIAARIAVGSLPAIASLPEVDTIEPDYPLELKLDVSAKAICATNVWPWIQGNSFTNFSNQVSVIDTGIDCSHPALSCGGSWNYYAGEYENTTGDYHGHGTHVAGIVSSANNIYRGVSPGVTLLSEKVTGIDDPSTIWSNVMSALIHSYNFGSEIATCSLGEPDSFLDYSVVDGGTDVSKTFDAYVEAGLTSTVCASNDGPNYETLTYPGDAFNVITVGAMDDNNTISRADDIVAAYSSRGMTYDGRTKPDVSAPGTNIMSCNNLWEMEDDFISHSGTSMATPHVAGMAALLVDEWARVYAGSLSGMGFMYDGPMAIRAMIYNSADETTGENSEAMNDRQTGTGYVDAYLPAYYYTDRIRAGINGNSLVWGYNLTNGGVETYDLGDVNPGETVKATIVWNRHVSITTLTPSGISDIDLYLRDDNGTSYASSLDIQTNWEKIRYTNTGTTPIRMHLDIAGFNIPTSVQTERVVCAVYKTPSRWLYFPDFTDSILNSSWRSHILIQNPTAYPARVDMLIRNRTGVAIWSGERIIMPHSEDVIRPRTLIGIDSSGSVTVRSNQSVEGVMQINRNNDDMSMAYKARISDYDLDSILGNQVISYYPDLTDSNVNSSWRSWIIIQNPGNSSSNINIQLRDRSGALRYSGNKTIPAYGVYAERPRNLLSGDFSGSAIITSYRYANVGVSQIIRNSNTMCMNYEATTGAMAQLYFPDLTDSTSAFNWRSYIVIQNTDNASTNVTIELRDRNGTLRYPIINRSISAHGVFADRPRNLLGSDFTGSAIVTSHWGPLVGSGQIIRNDNDMCMSYIASGSGEIGGNVYTSRKIPDFTDSNALKSWRSYLVIFNSLSESTTEGIELRDRSGNLLYSGHQTLPAYGASAIRPRSLKGSDCTGSAIVRPGGYLAGTRVSFQQISNNNDMCMAY